MNRQELIERMEDLKNLFGNKSEYVKIDTVIELISELDEPEAGHADEAPRYVKNVLARLRELPLHNREVWLKAIMSEFGQDFSHAKWREGYEQGKFEGMVGREKVTVPQFVAEKIDYFKKTGDWDLFQAMDYVFEKKEIREWLEDKNNQETFARAWLDGYEVEEEKRYLVKMKGLVQKNSYLNFNLGGVWLFYNEGNFDGYRAHHTRKELEEAGFGWVFDCPGIEIEEVK